MTFRSILLASLLVLPAACKKEDKAAGDDKGSKASAGEKAPDTKAKPETAPDKTEEPKDADKAADKAMVLAADAATLQWGPCPEMFPEGCEITVAHGNPAEPNADIFFRVPANYDIPMHWHTSPERMVLVSGEMDVSYTGQDTASLKTGDYAYGPAKAPHSAKCKDAGACTLFIAFQDPVDAHAIEGEPKAVEDKALAMAPDAKELQWGPCPEMFPEGCMISVAHGNPAEPNADIFFKVPAKYEIPHHWHTSAERMVLVKGEMDVEYDGQERTTVKHLNYAYGPAKAPHKAWCGEGDECILFIAFEEAVDAHPHSDAAAEGKPE